jgi:hypothetical protein
MRIVLFCPCLSVSLAGPARGQAAHAVDERVAFFIRSADPGATRGLRIGTPQECAPPGPGGLAMLVTFARDPA